MNGNIKFHKPKSPAFNQGEIWVSACGTKVEIVSVRKYPGASSDGMSSYGVTYKVDPYKNPEVLNEKDCWSFQVRYNHIADTVYKTKG